MSIKFPSVFLSITLLMALKAIFLGRTSESSTRPTVVSTRCLPAGAPSTSYCSMRQVIFACRSTSWWS